MSNKNANREFWSHVMLWSAIVCTCLLTGCNKKSGNNGGGANSESATKVDGGEAPGQLVASLKSTYEGLTPEQQKIKRLSDSEALIQSLTGHLKTLAKSFRDSATDVSSIVGSKIEYKGVSTQFDLEETLGNVGNDEHSVVSTLLELDTGTRKVAFGEVFKPLLMNQRFSDSQLGVLKGTFSDDFEVFEMETKFEGRIAFADGKAGGAKGYQTLLWNRQPTGAWLLSSWIQKDLKLQLSEQTLFEDVTAKAIPNEETRQKVARSSHQEMILRHSREKIGPIKDARPTYKSFNDWESAYQYPAVSVVDIDRDGFDDLFITDRWQSAQLLRNQGDGTFEDITEKSGLRISELANCAYFADFDNDGDSDVFVGRTLAASKYFVNEGGVFKPDSETNKALSDTRFVVSGSVVDINRDGLLDLYLSTYAYGAGVPSDWVNQTTRAEDRLKTRLKIERSHTYVDRGGPPNILLMNRGGKFEWVKTGDELKQYRNSYQTGWTDLDKDGDLDVYICNDFSPDVFLRNDTERGSYDVKFTDITKDIADTGAMGFGMGASWGDFNNDGDLDLYVSNMYSKAGNRIVPQVDGVDERIKVSAHGNFLYENVDGRFKQIAGTDDSQQHVSTVGWSFGGQFADFNNDGELDIYVPCGFYSPPQAVQGDIDL